MSLSKEDKDIFCFYAKTGHIDELIEFLETNPETDSTLMNNALVIATKEGQLDIVYHLLSDARTDPTFHNSLALRNAVKNGNVDVVKALFEDGRVDPDALQDQALMLASLHNDEDTVLILLQHGSVHPTARNNLAIRIAYHKKFRNIVKLLKRKPEVLAHPNQAKTVSEEELATIVEEGNDIDIEEMEIDEAREGNNSSNSNEEEEEEAEEAEESNEYESNDSNESNESNGSNNKFNGIRINDANVINRYLPNDRHNNILTSENIHVGDMMVQLNGKPEHVFTKNSIAKWWRTEQEKHNAYTNPLTRNPIVSLNQVKRFTAKWQPSVKEKQEKQERQGKKERHRKERKTRKTNRRN